MVNGTLWQASRREAQKPATVSFKSPSHPKQASIDLRNVVHVVAVPWLSQNMYCAMQSPDMYQRAHYT
eukprot:1156689-Pelagomonas_calceolata.AAC.7